MFSSHRQIIGDGYDYGVEWMLDPFDRHVDRLLTERAGENPLPPPSRRIAIDIGCGFGRRADSLSRPGWFDEVIACDVIDRTRRITILNAFNTVRSFVTRRPHAPIRFLQKNAADIAPSDLKDPVDYVNIRNVIHFMMPDEVRRTFQNILAIGKSDALLSLSFNYLHDETPDGLRFSIHDDDQERFKQSKQKQGVRAYYDPKEIVAYMEMLGFKAARVEIAGGRFEECHIIAHLPSGKRPQTSAPSRAP